MLAPFPFPLFPEGGMGKRGMGKWRSQTKPL